MVLWIWSLIKRLFLPRRSECKADVPESVRAAFLEGKLPCKARSVHGSHFVCCKQGSWFHDNLNNLFLVLDKVCIPTAKSESPAYYANVIFTRSITMVSSSKSPRALSLGQ